jgi:hypothetical protein
LHGFQEKLGDLSWLGPSYADQGWVELTEAEQEESRKVKVMSRIGSEKSIANAALNNPEITIEQKIAWSEYLIALEHVCLCPDFDCNPKIPSRPRA